ncbi:MAG: hypothetical protein ND895_11795 [Pyrinomonadaceae bacterium]|nr:hypothetical protein [Pyrinomonadaceae bacterium]
MGQFTNPLDHVRIAAPCKVDWQQMIGSERVRFCGQCNLNVYNLSSMTKKEAESLIAQTEGRLCVRFYRRTDGSILTDNCPVGLRAIRKRLSSVAKAASAAVLSFFAGVGVYRTVATPITPVMGDMVFTPMTEPRMGVIAEPMKQVLIKEQGEIALPATMGKLPLISPSRQNPSGTKAMRRGDK